MNAARSTARTTLTRSTRVGRTPARARFQSSSSSSTSSNAAGQSNSHMAAGAAGGLAAGIALYGIYLMTPSGKMHRTINKGAKEVNQKYNEAAKKLQGQTPDVDGAIKYMKEFAYSVRTPKSFTSPFPACPMLLNFSKPLQVEGSDIYYEWYLTCHFSQYVAWVPGGRQYVDTVFKDVETLKKNHRDEVNEIVSNAYRQFQELSKSGLSLEAASKAYNILTDLASKFGSLTGDALTDILDNHPQAKGKFGGSIDQLKEMGENYGPEAKKQVDETWKQVKEVFESGVSAANLDKARRLIEDKIQQVKKLGDEAWNKGLEGAKPYLDKNPKVKELIEKNATSLKQGNAKEVFDQAKKAVESGDTGTLEDYVNKARSKGEQAASNIGIDQYFKIIPSGSEILEKVNQLRDVAENHKDEGEKLLEETAQELKQVLEKKSEKAKQIVEKAKKDAK
ncbi:hypothetical protein NUW58_g4072 [Xylaria curta]|uniref:Uncharacterized protein n=1 Tax=Xylaria curta TaxID=42375 RepID=A0ACC1P810_9PEZI|nr:hypothetical protein NUW58_g4072 [Xylaria curta]